MMNHTLIIITGCIIATVGCKRLTKQRTYKDQSTNVIAKQIKITQLSDIVTQLRKQQLEYNFFGITSNGIDCIYFIPAANNFDLEFEVMTLDQKPYFKKLRLYAEQHSWKTSDTTYNNTPKYESNAPAPVLHIFTKASESEIAPLAKQLMADVFSNNDDTSHDIVP